MGQAYKLHRSRQDGKQKRQTRNHSILQVCRERFNSFINGEDNQRYRVDRGIIRPSMKKTTSAMKSSSNHQRENGIASAQVRTGKTSDSAMENTSGDGPYLAVQNHALINGKGESPI